MNPDNLEELNERACLLTRIWHKGKKCRGFDNPEQAHIWHSQFCGSFEVHGPHDFPCPNLLTNDAECMRALKRIKAPEDVAFLCGRIRDYLMEGAYAANAVKMTLNEAIVRSLAALPSPTTAAVRSPATSP
jgi:hypothetical protein